MTKPVGSPEVSAGGGILFKLMYGKSADVILGPTWKHDFLYKNRGQIAPAPDAPPFWNYLDPSGRNWSLKAGSYTRKTADEIYRHELREMGYAGFAAITYAVNRALGWFFWYDLNEPFK